MLYDIAYDKLPGDLQGILDEADIHHDRLLDLEGQVLLGLRDHGFITDERISTIRISDGGNYERLIDLRQRRK